MKKALSMKKYRVGILGCGEVLKWHKKAILDSPRLQCTQVFDPMMDRAKQAAAELGAAAAESAEAVLTADDVDIVAVLTPVFTHAQQVEIGAAAGKHLMLEKPMALTMEDGQRITNAIDKAGVKCFHPTIRALSSDLYEELRKWTAADGPVGPVQCGFYHLVGVPCATTAWMMNRKTCFPPAEYAPHVLDTFLSLTGAKPTTVQCHAQNSCRPVEQDDVTNINITFDNKRYLQMSVNWVVDRSWTCGSRVTFELVCERGFIRHDWFGATWFSNDAQGEYKSKRVETGGQRVDHYHELIHAIEHDTKLQPDHHAGLNYVRILDAAIRSIDQAGQTVTL